MASRPPTNGAAGSRVLVRLTDIHPTLRVKAAERLARAARLDEYRTAELYMAAVAPASNPQIWTTAEKADQVLRQGRLP